MPCGIYLRLINYNQPKIQEFFLHWTMQLSYWYYQLIKNESSLTCSNSEKYPETSQPSQHLPKSQWRSNRIWRGTPSHTRSYWFSNTSESHSTFEKRNFVWSVIFGSCSRPWGSGAFTAWVKRRKNHFAKNLKVIFWIRYESKNFVCVTELIDVEEEDPIEIINKWIICDGDDSRENRVQIFNPLFQYIGIGAHHHRDYEHVIVANLAGDQIPSVTNNNF